MSGKRHLRLGHQLRDEISSYIQKGLLKDPRIGFASISGLRLSKDLRHAKVFVSVLGSEEEGDATVEALQNARNFIRRQLGKDLHIRRVPELIFVRDDSIAEGVRISHLLEQVVHSDSSDEAEEDDDLPGLPQAQNTGPPPDNDTSTTPQASTSSIQADEHGNPGAMHTTSSSQVSAVTMQPEGSARHLSSWTPIVDVIRKGQRFLLAGHRHPDGDSIGAVTGLCGILQALGKDVVILNDTPLPEQFLFLPHTDKIQMNLDPNERFDAAILCDCGSVDRAPYGFPTTPEQRGTFVVIDHHQTSKVEGDICINEPDAAAVGLLIYELALALGVPLTREIAMSLYTALMADTGSFRYDKTNPYVLRVAADLLETGIKPWEIASSLYESMPFERQCLLARTLDTLELLANGKLATIHITSEMFDSTGASPHMTDGFINFARGIKGVEVAVMFREQEGGWKLSFRSRGLINVAEIAVLLGGGGHHNAAGAFLFGSLPEIKRTVCESVENVLLQAFLSV